MTAGLGIPMIIYGSLFPAVGLHAGESGSGQPSLGIPMLVAGLLHEATGIPLIAVGASDQWWSDEPRKQKEPWPPAVRPEVGTHGVGVRY